MYNKKGALESGRNKPTAYFHRGPQTQENYSDRNKEKHIQFISQTGSQNTYPFKTGNSLYNALVLSHCDYCSSVWSKTTNSNLETYLYKTGNSLISNVYNGKR